MRLRRLDVAFAASVFVLAVALHYTLLLPCSALQLAEWQLAPTPSQSLPSLYKPVQDHRRALTQESYGSNSMRGAVDS
jgi:hypothetical protein